MPGLSVVLLDEETLRVDDHPELNVVLVVEGITPDPTGRRPPERLELRLSSRTLADLGARIRATQQAAFLRARARAEREKQEASEQAAEAATNDTLVSTGALQRVVVALQQPDTTPGTAA